MTAAIRQSTPPGVADPACPVAMSHLREIAVSVATWGVHSFTLTTRESGDRRSVYTVAAEGWSAPAAPAGAARSSARVYVRNATVATVEVVSDGASEESLARAAYLVALRVGDAWAVSEEIDSLSGEIVHAYEELHLLYELGDALADQLTVALASEVILEKLLATLAAAWGELHLEGEDETFVRVNPRLMIEPLARGAQDHRLDAALRSNGQVIGKLALFRLHSDPTFSSADIKLFEAVGNFAGNAIRNAQLFEALRQQADTDSLTGLANHRAFQERLDVEMRRAATGGYQLGVMLIDIDNFKLFNDNYGHLVGDQIIRMVANELSQSCRTKHDVVGRYGGDEFVAILPRIDRQGLHVVAQRILDAASALDVQPPGSDRLPVSLSLGCALFPEDATLKHDLLGHADAALYEIKRAGGNGVHGTLDIQEAIASALVSGTAFGALQGLVHAVDGKDRYTRLHSEAVTDAALLLAKQLDLSTDVCGALRVAGLLHDVGKIGIPDQILRKPGRLTGDEYRIMQQHVTLSELMIKEVPHLVDVLSAVASHHERYDGDGYPRGLKGEEIPLMGRIMAIADACSAMLLDRPYRKGMLWSEVKTELLRGSGTQFDPELVAPFIDAIERSDYLRRLQLG
ncbi:MAG: diguanylate cyclase [Thermomicrobiales bacterium]